jgi:uncharacterized membrane protein YdjX (TVP38/TMEM64 family)
MNAQLPLRISTVKFSMPQNLTKVAQIAVVLFLLWAFRVPLGNLLQIVGNHEQVTAYVQTFGALGPVILFILLFAQVFIAVIPGHALMMTGGYVYGFAIGVTITAVSTIVASQAAFLLVRAYGRSLINRLASPQIIERWDKLSANQGTLFYFFAFVLPIFPSDLMCYVAGLGKISPRDFFVANLLGRSLCAISITLIGAFGFHPPLWFWIAVIVSMTVFFAGWAIYKKAHVHETEEQDERQL